MSTETTTEKPDQREALIVDHADLDPVLAGLLKTVANCLSMIADLQKETVGKVR